MEKILHNLLSRWHVIAVPLFFVLIPRYSSAQLVINPGGAAALASQLAGPGLNVFNVTYTGAPTAAVSFTANGTNLGLNSGILLATGNATVARGPNNSANAGITMGRPGSPELDTLAGTITFDAAILEFDFIPQNDTVSFRYVFASEEYPEYVCSPFNDVFAFYISGPGITGNQNMALIPGTTSTVAINSVNGGVIGFWGSAGPNCGLGYSNLYVDNTLGTTLQYDGFTKVMTARANVIPCQTYHLRLAIADAGDGGWDSGVFLEEGSLTTTPVVNAGPDLNICAGQTVNLGADPITGWTYSWSPTNGLSDPNISNPSLTLNPSGSIPVNMTYTVTATKGSCVLTDVVNVTVNPIATSSFIPAVTSACVSQPVQFTYTGNANASATYHWNFGGGTIISGSGQGPYYVSYPNAGTFTVSLSVDNGGCPSPVTTSQVTVTLPPVATFTIPASACPHDTITLNFTGQNTANAISQWNLNGANIISGNGLGPYLLTFNTTGTYTVTLDMNSQGCIPSQYTQTVTIRNLPVNAGPDISACSLTPINIGTTAVSGTTYSWTPSTGLNNPSISNPTVTILNNGTTPVTSQYFLTISQGNCVGYDTVSITTIPPPVATFTVPNASCLNDILNVNFTGQNPASANYNWTFNGANVISGSGLGPYQVSYTTIGTYTITLNMSVNGCPPVQYSQTINVGNSPAAAGPDLSYCSGSVINIGTAATPGMNYSWSPATGLSNPNISNPTVTLTNNGNTSVTQQYILTATNGNCFGSDTVNVTVIPPPVAAFTVPAASCVDDALNINFTGQSPAAANYQWSFNGGNVISGTGLGPYQVSYNTPGTHTITLDMSVSGCPPIQFSQTVTVGNSPAVAGPDFSYCSGTAVNIGIAGTPGMNYSWSPSAGLSDPNISNPSVVTSNNGNIPVTTQYILTTNNGNCYGSDTVDVTVIPPPVAAFTVPGASCIDDVLNITFTGQSPAASVYHWNFNGGNVISGSGLGPYQVSYNTLGTYTITLDMSVNGCPPVQYTQTVAVGNSPAAAGPDLSYCSGTALNIGVTGNPGMNYSWSPSIGLSNPNISNPAVTITNNGNVPVTTQYILTAINGSCFGSDTVNVTVIPPPVASFTLPGASCVDDVLNINFTGQSPLAANYQWSFNGANVISGSGLGPYQVSYSTIGTYNVTLDMSVNGCPPVQYSQTVIVGNSPAIAGPDLSYCSGTAVNIGVTGNPGMNYSWSPSAGLSNPNISNPAVTITNNGNVPVTTQYILTAINGSCFGSDTVDVTVIPPPVASFSFPGASCVDDLLNINFTGQSPLAANYQWSFNGANVISGSGLGPYQVSYSTIGTYNVTLDMSVNGCPPVQYSQTVVVGNSPASAGPDLSYCSGASVNIGTANNPGVIYSWSPATGLNNPNISNPSVLLTNNSNAPITTQYIVTATKGNCTGSDTVVVTVNPQPLSSFINLPDTICSGDRVQINFNGNASNSAQFNWNFSSGNILSGSGAGPYVVQFNSGGNNIISLDVNDFGCTSSMNDRVFVLDMPTSSIVLPPASCSGDTVQLIYTGSSSPSSVFNWNFGSANIIAGSGTGPYTLAWNSSGVFPVSLIVSNGICVSQNTQNIYIGSYAANAGPDASLCSGAILNIGSPNAAGFVYQWTPATGLNNAAISNPTLTISNSGNSPLTYQYILTASNGNCSAIDTVEVTVNPIPVSSFTSFPDTICAGDVTQFNFNGTAGSNAIFNWSFPSGNIISGNGAGPLNVQYNNGGIYSISLDVDDNGCLSTSSHQVFVRNLPDPAFAISPVACYGDTVQLNFTGTADPASIYNWNFGNANVISGSGSGPYSLLWNSPGTFPVGLNVINGNCQSQNTQSITITLPTFNAGTDQAYCSGLSATIGSAGNSNYTYTWNPSTGVSNVNDPQPVVTLLNNTNAPVTYDYICTAVENGCVATDTVSITINPLPLASISPLPDTICIGQQVPVSYTGTSSANANFNWNFGNATIVSGTGIGPYSIDFPSAGFYPFSLAVDQNGCNDIVKDSVVVNVPVTAQFSLPPNGCLADTVQIYYTGNGGNANYQWNFNGAGIISGTGSGPFNVMWPAAGNYFVSLDVQTSVCPGDQMTDSISITIPSADAGRDTVLCSGNFVSIGSVAQAGYQYQWTPSAGLANPNAASTALLPMGNSQNIEENHYQLLVTDAFGCKNNDSVSVTFFPKPELRFASPPPQCILGNSFSFSATGFNLPGIAYHWNFGANASIDSSNLAIPPSVSYSAAGNSNVSLYGTFNGCAGPREIHTVTVNEMPTPDFIPDIYEGCQPLSVHFTNLNSTNSTNYNWLIEGNVINAPVTDWTFNNPGTYEVDLTAVNIGGCSTTKKKPHLINVYALPVADFVSTPSYTIFPETEIDFSNISQGAEYTYWEFGDGSTETFYEGKHNYADTGTYKIILYISTNHGCKDTVDGIIRIDGGFSFFIPNAFTPNGDGNNDSFQGYGSFLDSYKMWIYDRWGLLIYYTEDYNKPWDGSMNSPVQNDTYVYRIIAEDLKGKEHVYVGSVTLVH